jgi:hypothetical protein
MWKFAFLFAVFLFIACNSSEKQQQEKQIEKKSNIYKQSEMAALMLLMYEKNAENKKMILEGKQPKQFPKEFLNIHTAKLTDSTDRDASFKSYSEYYLSTLKIVFETSKDSLKEKHNSVINSCITCHKTTCIGPIPKIKKLLIN